MPLRHFLDYRPRATQAPFGPPSTCHSGTFWTTIYMPLRHFLDHCPCATHSRTQQLMPQFLFVLGLWPCWDFRTTGRVGGTAGRLPSREDLGTTAKFNSIFFVLSALWVSEPETEFWIKLILTGNFCMDELICPTLSNLLNLKQFRQFWSQWSEKPKNTKHKP